MENLIKLTEDQANEKAFKLFSEVVGEKVTLETTRREHIEKYYYTSEEVYQKEPFKCIGAVVIIGVEGADDLEVRVPYKY